MSQPRITVVIGNTGERSRTRALALGIVDALLQRVPAAVNVLEIHRLVGAIATVGPLPLEGVAAVKSIESADLVVAVTPVYKGSYSGLFKHLFDLVGPDALVDTPVLLAANGGSDRHALVVDHQLRPLFAFFRALTVPSAVYAVEGDFDGYTLRSPALLARIDEAAGQASRLLGARGFALHSADTTQRVAA